MATAAAWRRVTAGSWPRVMRTRDIQSYSLTYHFANRLRHEHELLVAKQQKITSNSNSNLASCITFTINPGRTQVHYREWNSFNSTSNTKNLNKFARICKIQNQKSWNLLLCLHDTQYWFTIRIGKPLWCAYYHTACNECSNVGHAPQNKTVNIMTTKCIPNTWENF